jgi:hypothetical protein
LSSRPAKTSLLLGLAALALFTALLIPGSALALVGTNPPSGNPGDYSGSGDWEGSDQNDQLTNEAGATVDGNLNGRLGSDHIINQGRVVYEIYGSYNRHDGDSSGGNTIESSGEVGWEIYGSLNVLDFSANGERLFANRGAGISGLSGGGLGYTPPSGGNNTIIHTGRITGSIIGSANFALESSGGGNTIINSGWVRDGIYGSGNMVLWSSGGDNYIENSGTVEFEIVVP